MSQVICPGTGTGRRRGASERPYFDPIYANVAEVKNQSEDHHSSGQTDDDDEEENTDEDEEYCAGLVTHYIRLYDFDVRDREDVHSKIFIPQFN